MSPAVLGALGLGLLGMGLLVCLFWFVSSRRPGGLSSAAAWFVWFVLVAGVFGFTLLTAATVGGVQ